MPLRFLLLLATMLVAFSGSLSAAVPVDAMFRNAEFSDVQLSPDGAYLSAITRTRQAPKARNLVVLEIATGQAKVVTGYDTEDVRNYTWTSDDRMVFKVDRDFDEATKYGEYIGTYSVRRDGKGGRVCHEPFMRDKRSLGSVAAGGAVGGVRETIAVLDPLIDDPDYILAEKIDRRLMFPDAFRMNIRSGRMQRVAANHGNVIRWIADNDGSVRAAIELINANTRRHRLIYRHSNDADWQPLLDFEQDELAVLGFAKNNRDLFVASRIGRDRMALYKLEPGSADLGTPLVEDPVYDVYSDTVGNVGHLRQTNDGSVAYYQYMADKPVTRFFDARWQARQSALDDVLPDTVNTIVDWDKEERRFLVNAWSDRQHGSWYLYDEKRGKLKFLVAERSWLSAASMAEMLPVQYASRDGLTIHGYLTLPAGSEPKTLPLIVHPHGGPFGIRDEWGFNAEVQFLASRGYAVLQMNYRGSGGYGRTFQTAGYKKWGLEMQDDITDGVRWAIEQGYADPERICIYGASYGGYATMMGLVKTPDLYSCGINYVGVVDLGLQVRHWNTNLHVTGRQEWIDGWVRMAIGDPDTDAERFAATSPLNHIEKLSAPLLVVHGRLDPRVDIHQYQKLVEALKRHDKPFEHLVKRHEGHGFFAEQNKIELYEQIERFLGEHL